MRLDIIEIWRIETLNSTYEIKVVKQNGHILSMCKKMGEKGERKQVNAEGTAYLDKLVIGASFDIPGVVQTSNVEDYQRYVLSGDPKRHVPTVEGGFQALTDAILAKVNPEPVRVG